MIFTIAIPPDKDAEHYVGAILRGLRGVDNLTSNEVGDRIGVSGKQVTLMERGKAGITVTTLQRWCRALGLRVEFGVVPGMPVATESEPSEASEAPS